MTAHTGYQALLSEDVSSDPLIPASTISFWPITAADRKKGTSNRTPCFTRRGFIWVLGGIVSIGIIIAFTPSAPIGDHASRLYTKLSFSASRLGSSATSQVNYEAQGGHRVLNTQERAVWKSEEQILRRWNWTVPSVHSSLQDELDEMNPVSDACTRGLGQPILSCTDGRITLCGDQEERKMREWIRRLRIAAQRGTGIGLGGQDEPRPIQSAEEHGAWRKELDMSDLRYYGGESSKLGLLLEESTTGQAYGSCPTLDWEDEYARLHENIMTGRAEPRILEYTCKAGSMCGGLADRLLGMSTTFLYAVLTKRAFVLGWEHPIPPDLVFDSPRIDWSTRFRPNSTAPRSFFDSVPDNVERLELDAHNPKGATLNPFWRAFPTEYNNQPWIAFDALNRGIVLRSFGSTYIYARQELMRMGLKQDSVYRCMMNYILRPKPASLEFIHRYTSYFSLPSVFSIGIQIRAGDYSMESSDSDTEINTMKRNSHFFTCATQVAETYSKPGQRVVFYLITDSNALRNEALERFPGTVVTGLLPAHGEHGGRHGVISEFRKMQNLGNRLFDPEDASQDLHDMFNTVAESWIFASTDFQIITRRSGFGKVPTFMRGRPGSTINLYQTTSDKRPQGRKAMKAIAAMDCTMEKELMPFTEIASEWSLG